MVHRRVLRPLAALLASAIAAVASAQDGWHVRGRAAQDGPTLLVVAVDPGAGAAAEAALRQVGHWSLAHGALVTARPLRFAEIVDDPRVRRVGSLAALTAELAPDAVIVLREARAPEAAMPDAEGSTVGYTDATGDAARRGRRAGDLVVRLLDTAPDAGPGHWGIRMVDYPDWAGGAPVWIVTTTHENERKEQRLSLRARQHRVAVRHVLHLLGMVDDATEVGQILPATRGEAIRVAVYDGDGAISSSGHGPPWIVATLGREHGWVEEPFDFAVEPLGPFDIAEGALADCDVVLFGGGSARAQGRGLGAELRDAVRRHVAGGGGYVGICAGAFLACTDSEHDLGLIDMTGKAAHGSLEVHAVFEAGSALGCEGPWAVRYSNGPRLEIGETAGMAQPVVWARFGERGMDGERARLIGTPAIVAAPFGEGRAVAFSPHCERVPGPRRPFLRSLRWAAGR